MSSSSSRMCGGGQKYCHCGYQAWESTAHTFQNHGRKFWGCQNYANPVRGCNFFEWKDPPFGNREMNVIRALVKQNKELKQKEKTLEDMVASLNRQMKQIKTMQRRVITLVFFAYVIFLCLSA